MNGRVLFLLLLILILLILKYLAILAIAIRHSDSMNQGHNLWHSVIFAALEPLQIAGLVVSVSSVSQNSILCVSIRRRVLRQYKV